jgi:hypothetical protein
VREALPWIKIGASAMTRAPQVDPVRRGLLAAALMVALPAVAADGAITLVVPLHPAARSIWQPSTSSRCRASCRPR